MKKILSTGEPLKLYPFISDKLLGKHKSPDMFLQLAKADVPIVFRLCALLKSKKVIFVELNALLHIFVQLFGINISPVKLEQFSNDEIPIVVKLVA